MSLQRLDKLMAATGRWSRREAKELIRQGRVLVNGLPARSGEEKADPEAAAILVDGTDLGYSRFTYVMLNKPAGVLSATEDPRQGTVLDLLAPELRRRGLFPVGRLDAVPQRGPAAPGGRAGGSYHPAGGKIPPGKANDRQPRRPCDLSQAADDGASGPGSLPHTWDVPASNRRRSCENSRKHLKKREINESAKNSQYFLLKKEKISCIMEKDPV